MAIDDPMRREKMLCLSSRLESLHLPFSSSGRPMRVFSPVIQTPARAMPDIRQDGALSNAVTAQSISDEPPGFVLQPAKQTPEEALGCLPIPSTLHKNVQHDFVLIHGAP